MHAMVGSAGRAAERASRRDRSAGRAVERASRRDRAAERAAGRSVFDEIFFSPLVRRGSDGPRREKGRGKRMESILLRESEGEGITGTEMGNEWMGGA